MNTKVVLIVLENPIQHFLKFYLNILKLKINKKKINSFNWNKTVTKTDEKNQL